MKNSEKVIAILKGIDSLLSDESKWTQGTYARNAMSDSVLPETDDATCYCLSGALLKVSDKAKVPDSVFLAAYKYLNDSFDNIAALHWYQFRSGLPFINDHADTTFAVIKAGIARAIQTAEAAQ